MVGQHRLCGGTSRLLRGACPLHPWPSLGPLSGVRGQWRRETGGSGKNEIPSRLGSLADLCCAFKKKEVLWVPPQFLHHPSSPPLHHLSSPSLHHPCSPSLHHPCSLSLHHPSHHPQPEAQGEEGVFLFPKLPEETEGEMTRKN